MNCVHCGCEMPEGKRTDAKYCSKSCGNKARNKRYRGTDKHKNAMQRWNESNHEKNWMSHIKYKCKVNNIPFNLTLEDFVIPEKCPLLGTKLTVNNKVHGVDTPTMDRIDPKGGYVKGNVWVISHLANVMKNEATLEQAEMLVENWRKEIERRRSICET
jgi:hypothetical protein